MRTVGVGAKKEPENLEKVKEKNQALAKENKELKAKVEQLQNQLEETATEAEQMQQRIEELEAAQK